MSAGTGQGRTRLTTWMIAVRLAAAAVLVVNGATWWADEWEVPWIGPLGGAIASAAVLVATSVVDWHGGRAGRTGHWHTPATAVGDTVLALLLVIGLGRDASDAIPLAILFVAASMAVRGSARLAVGVSVTLAGSLILSRLAMWPAWSTEPLPDSGWERLAYGPVLIPLLVPLFVRVLHGLADERDRARALAEDRAWHLDAALQDLQRANERLEVSNAELELYGQRIAHDLQSPLSSVIGGIETLRAHHERLSDEQRDELLDRSHRAAWTASRALSALLEQAVHGDTGNRQRVNLGELANQLVAVTASAPTAVEVSVDGIEVIADPDLLPIVLQNLLLNAVQHGGTNVRIRASQARDTVDVIVEDDGPGIPEEVREHVFGLGVRGDASRGGGQGLGLATVRTIVEHHGGWVRVEDSPLGGAAFRFTLPSGRGYADGSGTDATNSSSGSSSRTPAPS